jgi:hypothetical protein
MSATRSGIILTACLFLLLTWGPTEAATDPWSPNRKFCGRLTIIIASAGELEEPMPINKAGKTMDILSVHTWANFLQFSGASTAAMPAYSIVMTSDPKLKDVLNQMSQSEKQTRGFLGVVPASIDSFRDLLSSDSKVSTLERAISRFSENKDCRERMKKEGYDSVLPLLKVEIVIESENSNQQIPLWTNRSETGSLKSWASTKHRAVLGKDLLHQLLKRFDGAVVEAFVGACEGADLGKYFQMRDQCACYLSATDNITVLNLSGTHAPFGAQIGEEGANILALQKTFAGSPSVLAMVPTLLSTNCPGYVMSAKDRIG